MKVLAFKLGDEAFALDIIKVRKLVESPRLYPIPLAPPFFRGAINFHNRIIPVMDLAAYLEMFTHEQDSRVIVLDPGQGNLGLSVSSIAKFSDLEEVQTLPATSNSAVSSVSHLVNSNNGETIRILDLARLQKSLESYMASKDRNAWYFSEPIPFIPGCERRQDLSEEAAIPLISPAFPLFSKP